MPNIDISFDANITLRDTTADVQMSGEVFYEETLGSNVFQVDTNLSGILSISGDGSSLCLTNPAMAKTGCTMAFWIQFGTLENGTIAQTVDSRDNIFMSIRIVYGQICGEFNTADKLWKLCTSTLEGWKWNHVVFIWHPILGFRLYVNSVYISFTDSINSTTISTSEGIFTIGFYDVAYKIDSIMIWKYLKTSEFITELFIAYGMYYYIN